MFRLSILPAIQLFCCLELEMPKHPNKKLKSMLRFPHDKIINKSNKLNFN